MPASLPPIKDVFADLLAVGDAPGDWRSPMQAPRTMPSGEPVSRWYLVSYFLRHWAEAYAAACGKQRLASDPRAGFVPPRSKALRAYEAQAIGWATDSSLDGVLSEQLAKASGPGSAGSRSVDEVSLYRATVEAHEWCVVLSVLDAVARHDPHARPNDRQWPILPLTSDGTRDLAAQVSRSRAEIDPQTRGIADTFLRHYRASKSAFSWKPFCRGLSQQQIRDPLFSFGDEPTVDERDVAAIIAELCRQTETPRGLVKSVIERVAAAIAQQGYDGFAREARSGGLFADGVLGDDESRISVIPGEGMGRCAPMLLAIARGGTAKTGMKAVAKLIRLHLSECENLTDSVLIVTDEWKHNVLDESLDDFRLRARKGVRFSVLMCPQPGHELVRLPVRIL